MEDNHYYDYLKKLNITEEDKQALYHLHEQDIQRDKDKMNNIELAKEERERKLLATKIALKLTSLGIAGTIAIAGIAIVTGRKNMGINPNANSIVYNDENIILTRKYTIKYMDTIDGISSKTGIPKSTIVYDNNIENPNLIDINKQLILNYSVSEEDLKYYTQTISVEGKSIYEIIGEYNTTIKTLCDINKEAIEYNGNGNYTILSNTILVPNFITQSELKEAKAKGK